MNVEEEEELGKEEEEKEEEEEEKEEDEQEKEEEQEDEINYKEKVRFTHSNPLPQKHFEQTSVIKLIVKLNSFPSLTHTLHFYWKT